MADFDINKELEVINISDNLNEINLSSGDSIIDIEYFYHGHRLGTRVPLFVIISSEDWNEDAICYFCKIGNTLSIKNSSLMSQIDSVSHLLSKLLRRYGSNYGIMIQYCTDSVNTKVQNIVLESLFLKSEINCIVNITEKRRNTLSSYDIPVINVEMVNYSDLQNAMILERIQRELKLPCLDWNWQYEQSDKLFLFSNLVFKNLEKWKNTESRGVPVEGTRIIPMKLMRDNDEEHSPQHILDLYPNLGFIIDLSNDEGSYDKSKFIERNIEYQRIQIESKVIPSSTDVFQFISIVKDFKAREADKDIIVHCHYGYNRTGLMICAYLIEEVHVTVQEALKRFKAARPPGIKHQNYIDKLVLRYSTNKPLEVIEK